MADILSHPNVQDFASAAPLSQSPAGSSEDLPSSITFHANCRKCHHWFNKQTIPWPFPKDQSFHVECPECHTKLVCFGTQSSQETFMSQATDVPGSMDLASIESILPWSPRSGSSERVLFPVHLPRSRTEPALSTMVTASGASEQPGKHQRDAKALCDQDGGRTPLQNLQDNAETTSLHISDPINTLAAPNSDEIDLAVGSQALQEQSHPESCHAVLESVLRDAQPTNSEDTRMIASEEPKTLKYSMPRSTKLVINLPRKISRFIKTKFRHISSLRRHHQSKKNMTTTESPTLLADRGLVFNATTAPTQSHRDSQDSARTVEAVQPSQTLLAAPSEGLTDHARARASSEPHDMSNVTGTAIVPKDEYRRQVRQENSRKARKRESKHRRCPCWPDCQCFPDVPRLQVQRSNTLPSRSLTDVPSVRDLLRTDSFYHEIQHLAQQARGQRGGQGSGVVNQAQQTPSQAPSQDFSWNSLGTTLSDNPGSVDLTASMQDYAPQQTNYVQAPYLNTNVGTETLVDEDQNTTPQPGQHAAQPDDIDFESADDMLRGVGEIHHDSNNTHTDEADQRN